MTRESRSCKNEQQEERLDFTAGIILSIVSLSGTTHDFLVLIYIILKNAIKN